MLPIDMMPIGNHVEEVLSKMSDEFHTEALPKLENTYPLSGEQIRSYQQDGHIVLRGVASPEEIDSYEPVIRSLVKAHNRHTKPVHERNTYGKAFIQVGNLWEMSEAVKRFVLAKRFAKIAAALMGVDGVRIYHDQALFKEPGGGHTPWHQDQMYWPLDTNHTITMWMPLVPVTEEVGSMTFASATHRSGSLSQELISDESHRTFSRYIETKGIETVNYGALAAGDATFHSGWTLHSAPGNPTETMREVMTVIYFADGTRALEPGSNARRNDLNRWLPGIDPGMIAASPLNPLVYKRE